MRQQILVVLLVAVSLAGFSAYCYACVDWLQNFGNGVYSLNKMEGFYETATILIYTFAALRFMVRRVNR